MRSTAEEYVSDTEIHDLLESVNFNPNNGVVTTFVINAASLDDLNAPTAYDYALVLDGDGAIESRWFIVQAERLRGGQYRLTLKRDQVADHLSQVLSAPCFVQRGWVQDGNPLVVNPEGVSVNQIKQSETLLKDVSNVPWIVGYVARNYAGGDISYTDNASGSPTYTFDQIAQDVGVSSSVLTAMVNTDGTATNQGYAYNGAVDVGYGYLFSFQQMPTAPRAAWAHHYIINFSEVSRSSDTLLNLSNPLYHFVEPDRPKAVLDTIDSLLLGNMPQIRSDVESALGAKPLTPAEYSALANYNGKTISYLGGAYRFRVAKTGASSLSKTGIAYSAYTGFNAVFTGAGKAPEEDGTFEIKAECDTIAITLEAVSSLTHSVTIGSDRNKVTSQTFDMFAIPCGRLLARYPSNGGSLTKTESLDPASTFITIDLVLHPTYVYSWSYSAGANVRVHTIYQTTHKVGTSTFDSIYVAYTATAESSITITYSTQTVPDGGAAPFATDEDVGRAMASAIQLALGDSCYDLQLLPYCPTQAFLLADGSLNLGAMASGRDYALITDGSGASESIVLWCTDNSFTANLPHPVSTDLTLKESANLELYRICSPNYQGAFEFSLAKNGGSVDYFTAYCTYKPYSPFIKVAPNFKWLYATDFNDQRGLICSGDFSLGRYTSLWQTYQLNNKNYQNIFNREIQSMDYQHGIEMQKAAISVALGGLGQVGFGTAAGTLMSGNPLIGAGVGLAEGAASWGAGIADINYAEESYREKRDLAFDKWTYTLGNIKALPYTLTKVEAFTVSNKIWPFLEVYRCSDEELRAFREKIAYTSMAVGVVGTIGDYYDPTAPHYVKGELIRLEGMGENAKVDDDLYAEILRGVYL